MAAMESDGCIRINYREYEHWKYEKFACVVNNMLLRRKNIELHKFQLCFEPSDPRNFKDVRTWIQYAVAHGVKVLDVNLGWYDKTFLPRCIFTCRSLEELKLEMGEAPYGELDHEGLMLPDKIYLPSLKKLNLCDVEVSTLTLRKIIDGCPGLEDVHLSNCAQYLELVESNMLKRLEIHGFFNQGKGLTIAAPNLTHFECIGWSLEEICWQKQPSLESAHIDTWCSGCTFDGQSDLIGIVLHAKRLALCGSDIKDMLEKELPTSSLFDNLVTLEIGGWCLTNDLYVVVRFLQLSPRLEKLTLRQRELCEATKEETTSSRSIAGMTFKCPLLETVIIQCSKDDVKIEETIAAMVALDIGLEKIQVNFYEDIERAERWGVSLEELKEQDKMLKENRERAKGSKARSDNSDNDDEGEMESDNNDDKGEMEDEDCNSYEEEMDDEESEMDDEDDDEESEMDDEDDDEESEMDDEDDDEYD